MDIFSQHVDPRSKHLHPSLSVRWVSRHSGQNVMTGKGITSRGNPPDPATLGLCLVNAPSMALPGA